MSIRQILRREGRFFLAALIVVAGYGILHEAFSPRPYCPPCSAIIEVLQ